MCKYFILDPHHVYLQQIHKETINEEKKEI